MSEFHLFYNHIYIGGLCGLLKKMSRSFQSNSALLPLLTTSLHLFHDAYTSETNAQHKNDFIFYYLKLILKYLFPQGFYEVYTLRFRPSQRNPSLFFLWDLSVTGAGLLIP